MGTIPRDGSNVRLPRQGSLQPPTAIGLDRHAPSSLTISLPLFIAPGNDVATRGLSGSPLIPSAPARFRRVRKRLSLRFIPDVCRRGPSPKVACERNVPNAMYDPPVDPPRKVTKERARRNILFAESMTMCTAELALDRSSSGQALVCPKKRSAGILSYRRDLAVTSKIRTLQESFYPCVHVRPLGGPHVAR